jgi:hypothetical protein
VHHIHTNLARRLTEDLLYKKPCSTGTALEGKCLGSAHHVSAVLYRSCVAAHIEQAKHCRVVGHVQGFQRNAYTAYKGKVGVERKDDTY